MTTIPYETHIMILQACAPYMDGIKAAFRSLTFAQRLRRHPARQLINRSPVIWYFKDTKLDLAFSRQTGYILLDHVRRVRSPGFPNYDAAIKARTAMLKDIEAYEDTRRQEADAAAQAAEVPQA